MQGPLVLAVGTPHDTMVLRSNIGDDQGFELAFALSEADAMPRITAENPRLLLVCADEIDVPTAMVARLVAASRAKSLPVIIWSSRADVQLHDLKISDRVLGADAISHLPARIRSTLRREHPNVLDETFAIGDIRLEGRNARATCRGNDISLRMTEFRLLAAMLERHTDIFDRTTLWNLLNGCTAEQTTQNSRTLDQNVSRLRRAFTGVGEHNVIRSVRGIGYILEPSAKRS